MTKKQWQDLHDWIFRVFPSSEAAEVWQLHIEEGRQNDAANVEFAEGIVN